MADGLSLGSSSGGNYGTPGDCDLPGYSARLIQWNFESGFERSNHPGPRRDTTENLLTALGSCGQLMTSMSEGDALQDPQQVLALERSMRDVFLQLRTPLNRARPINRLPPEILSMIFRLATGLVRAPDLRDVLPLSSICRDWRAIVLRDSGMWSDIRLTGQDPNFVLQQVERCRGAPLHVFIDMPHTVFRVEGLPLRANFKQVAPVIRARRNQVRSISVVIGGCRGFQQEFGLDWPDLEELVWVDACPAGSRTHDQNPPAPENDNPAPLLKYLSSKQGLAWEMKATPSLTALKLEGPMDIDILKFLRNAPNLEFLELIKLGVQPPSANVTPIDLPRLAKVVMSNVEYGQLFVHVTLSTLMHLIIDPVEAGDSMRIVWGKLQIPPTITELKIEHLEHRRNKIFITGSDGTKARSFKLTDYAESTRSTAMTQALCHTSLASVTSLSVGRGVSESGVQLPSIPICALIPCFPHLLRLDIFPSRLSLAIVKYLHDHPLTCPELRVLSLTLTRETCQEVFGLLLQLISDRADSEHWLHRIDCVVLRAAGSQEARDIWESSSQDHKLEEYLRCNCVEENACWETPCTEMYPTETKTFQRYSYRLRPSCQLGLP